MSRAEGCECVTLRKLRSGPSKVRAGEPLQQNPDRQPRRDRLPYHAHREGARLSHGRGLQRCRCRRPACARGRRGGAHRPAAGAARATSTSTALLAAAKLAGADAVHPGYGFLSENAAFAEACAEAGLVFIGPPAAAIAAMGNKARAKALMQAAGVPCVPGYRGTDQSDETLIAEGAPHRLSADGQGRGRRRRARHAARELLRDDLAAGAGAQPIRSASALRLGRIDPRAGDRRRPPRRDSDLCRSARQRHPSRRTRLLDPAAAPESHRGGAIAGGVDRHCASRWARPRSRRRAPSATSAPAPSSFCSTGRRQFYFLEMNTRLQVEHPVTEAVTGLDLVAWQLRIAAGEKLPLEQHQLRSSGHAIEARLYAEDPRRMVSAAERHARRLAPGERRGRAHRSRPRAGLHGQPVLRSDAGQADRARGDARGGAAPADRGARGYRCARAEDEPQLPDRRAAPSRVCRRRGDDGVHRSAFPGGRRRHAAPRRRSSRILALAAVLLFEARARSHQASGRCGTLVVDRRCRLAVAAQASATPIMPSASRSSGTTII